MKKLGKKLLEKPVEILKKYFAAFWKFQKPRFKSLFQKAWKTFVRYKFERKAFRKLHQGINGAFWRLILIFQNDLFGNAGKEFLDTEIDKNFLKTSTDIVFNPKPETSFSHRCMKTRTKKIFFK